MPTGSKVVVYGGGYRLSTKEYELDLPDEDWFQVTGIWDKVLYVTAPGSLAIFKVLREQCKPFKRKGKKR